MAERRIWSTWIRIDDPWRLYFSLYLQLGESSLSGYIPLATDVFHLKRRDGISDDHCFAASRHLRPKSA